MRLVGRLRVGDELTIPGDAHPLRGFVVVDVNDDEIRVQEVPTLCCLCEKEPSEMWYWGKGVCRFCLDILKKNLALWT